jgi:hypothetical protein
MREHIDYIKNNLAYSEPLITGYIISILDNGCGYFLIRDEEEEMKNK